MGSKHVNDLLFQLNTLKQILRWIRFKKSVMVFSSMRKCAETKVDAWWGVALVWYVRRWVLERVGGWVVQAAEVVGQVHVEETWYGKDWVDVVVLLVRLRLRRSPDNKRRM